MTQTIEFNKAKTELQEKLRSEYEAARNEADEIERKMMAAHEANMKKSNISLEEANIVVDALFACMDACDNATRIANKLSHSNTKTFDEVFNSEEFADGCAQNREAIEAPYKTFGYEMKKTNGLKVVRD